VSSRGLASLIRGGRGRRRGPGGRRLRTFGHPWLGTEHLLLGVLAQPDAPGVSALSELGVTLDAGRAGLSQVVGRLVPDADALRTIGIDVDEVRRRAEASFGPSASKDAELLVLRLKVAVHISRPSLRQVGTRRRPVCR
jgi:Clp amino terminal domain, pathogenicity island component